MTTGSVILNGITDHELIIVLEVKERHEGHPTFNPQQMQAVQQGTPPKPGYNNMVLGWPDHQGLNAIKEILHRLTSEKPYQPQQ
jgi:hypothetical protein